MEKVILSLKSIYMLLMTDDFPIYSESVISKADRKGQTLLRFWQCQIAEEFRSLPYGRMIWRDSGKRNRYISYLCNRSAELRCYQEYAKELSSRISTASLLSQIGRFMEFLSGRKYRQDILFRRASELVRLVEREDIRVSDEIARQLEAAAAPALQEDSQGRLFEAGYLLTLLTLYSAAGEAMDSRSMAVLRGDGYSLEELWKSYGYGRKKEGRQPMEFFTIRSSLLQDNPLPRERFFGREVELYDLWEMVAAQKKCAVCGIGGIGKTELLRQLLRRCQEEGAVDQIAVVPYISDIMESFARAFPGSWRRKPEEAFHGILYQMEQAAGQGRRILLLIDDVTRSPEEDPALKMLEALPCGILITTRQQGMEGFGTYRIQPPAVPAGMLIFRDNYGSPLTREDRAALTDMLADGALCHPATLRLMARAARSKGWSVEGLKRQLEKNGISLSWQEEDRTVSMVRMYRQLYSYMRIPRECQALVELFTLLPRDSYSAAFLREAFPKVAGEATEPGEAGAAPRMPDGEASLERRLGTLVLGGWLEDDGSGYSMHPLIAQCLRRRVLTEGRLEPVLGHIRERLLGEDVGLSRWEEASASGGGEVRRIWHVFVSVCKLLSGSVSRNLMLAILTALGGMLFTKQEVEWYERWLMQLTGRCPEKDDQVEVLLYTVLGRLGSESDTQFAAVYYRQKERLTVPLTLFLDFCLTVGETVMEWGNFALGRQLIQEALCDAALPDQKAHAYCCLSMLCEAQGDLEGERQWSQVGMEYVTGHTECGAFITFSILCMCCVAYVRLGQNEAAKALLEKMQSLLQEDFPDTLKQRYENVAGVYELTFGDMEKTLYHYSNSLELCLKYAGKRQGYFASLSQIAIVLQRLKRYEEAISAYSEVLDYVRENGDIYGTSRIHNNLAVLYLDMGKPREALPHLLTAVEEGRRIGGIPLAEPLRNMARAYGLLGDSAREHAYYKEAVPLLEKGYGPEHPRTIEARTRLEELEKKGEGKPEA